MNRIACIYNSSSGSSVDKDQIRQTCESVGLAVDFLPIQLDAQQIKSKLKTGSYAAVVAAGGDGTVRFTAQLAVENKHPLGILPLGTLNHFAKDLQIPVGLEDAVKIIANNVKIGVDYGLANERVFVNNASLGIYPSTVTERDKSAKRLGKWLAAVKAFAGSLSDNDNLHCTVTSPEGSYRYTSPLLFVGNNEYTIEKAGPGSRYAVNTGNLFLYIVGATKRRKLLLIAMLGLLGIRLRGADVSQRTPGPVQIDSQKGSATVALDGEVYEMQFPLQISINSKGLSVMGNPAWASKGQE